MGQVFRAQRRYAEAISEYEAALARDRNLVNALAHIGRLKIYGTVFINPLAGWR
jgi:hypothetical protein